jgi:hypothetical protein
MVEWSDGRRINEADVVFVDGCDVASSQGEKIQG